MLFLSALLSIIAIFKTVLAVSVNPEDPFFIGSTIIIIPVSLVFWLALQHGTDTAFQPDLFWELGPKGGFIYFHQCVQFFRRGLGWPVIDVIHKTINNIRGFDTAFAITFSVALAFAVVGASAGALADADSIVVVGIVTIVVAFAVFVVGFVTDAGAGANALAIASALAIAFAGVGAIVGFTAVIGAVTGIKVWNQFRSTSETTWRPLAMLAFPWFCWFPSTVTFSIWALYDLLSKVSPLNLPIWQQTVIVTSAMTGLCAALWWRGQWLDAKARNPFQGGALGKALGANH